MANTTNFGWETPDDTDLVKDGAAAMRTLGNAIDASLVDLKGGTTGQVLSKASNTDLDYSWVTPELGDITAVTVSSPITGGGTTGSVNIAIQDGTTAQKGAVQLEDSTSSSSTTKAATPNSVKTAYDLANGAIAKSIVDAKGDLITATANDTPARLAVGNDGEIIVGDSSTSTGLRYNPNTGGLFNPTVNGGMDIWQRGTSISVAASTNTYTADRWQTSTGANQACTISRQTVSDSTNLPNIQYALRYQRNSGQTGTGQIPLVQSFESTNSIPFAGKTVTLSFYARVGANFSPTSNAFVAYLITGTGTDENRLTGYTGDNTSINANLTGTTTWQRFVVTGTIPTTAKEMAVYFIWTPSGTAGANDWIEFTGVQIDIGTYTASTAPTFRRAGGTLAGELAAAMRYYQRYTTPVAYGTLSNGGFSVSTTQFNMFQPLPVPMRVAPTSIDYSSNLAIIDTAAASWTASALSLATGTSTPLSADFSVTVSGATAGRWGYVRANNSTASYIGFSAEL